MIFCIWVLMGDSTVYIHNLNLHVSQWHQYFVMKFFVYNAPGEKALFSNKRVRKIWCHSSISPFQQQKYTFKVQKFKIFILFTFQEKFPRINYCIMRQSCIKRGKSSCRCRLVLDQDANLSHSTILLQPSIFASGTSLKKLFGFAG